MNEVRTFSAGRISQYVGAWKQVTHDPWVIHVVEGFRIPFYEIPKQTREPFPYRLSPTESEAATLEVQKLCEKGVLEIVESDETQVLSNIFLRPKKDGTFRMILDLTWVNKHVIYEHFKMCSLETAKDMLRENCWMASVDLRDAYYSVRVHEEDRKYLRFKWNGLIYQFTCMPNGLACAPRFFTKLLNPVFAHLRNQGHETFQYIDDSFIVADTKEDCIQSVTALCDLLQSLGFVIHQDKSILEPSQVLNFLGFTLDSVNMKVFLTNDKEEKFLKAAKETLAKKYPTIREVAGLIGLMIAYSRAFDFALAHVKCLERDKIEALKISKGNFSATMSISHEGICDIWWWINHIHQSGKNVYISDPDFDLYVDASEAGWGAHVGDTSTGGRWTFEESQDHINILELRAIYFALKSFCKQDFTHVKVLTDNTTALAYVKHMGGVRSSQCNELAQQIWRFCEEHTIWITIAHVPGVHNVVADYKSRHFSDNVEWTLSPRLFDRICDHFGLPDIDLFASRLNNKLPIYVSFTPDPGAFAIDAFTIAWNQFNFFYAFPPFSCISKVLRKIVHDQATGVLVVPWWPSQPWWARLHKLAKKTLKFKVKENNLIPVGTPNNIEFLNRCPLGACLFFAKSVLAQGFDKQTVLLMMDAWRPSTKKIYTTYLNKWAVYCVERGIAILNPTLPQACRFLRLLSDDGLGYGALNTARSALSTILPSFGKNTFGSHPYVCLLLKGAYERNPPKPRYTQFWDVNKVFNLFKSWGPNAHLSLKMLSFKLAMLLLLVTSQRGQTIVNLVIDDLELSNVVVFKMKKLLKHNKPGDPLDTLVLRPFDQCKRLCVVRALKMYLQKTKCFRTYSNLLLSFIRPHKPISRDTLSRWVLITLKDAGLDTSKYKSHSTRGASASAAKRLGVPLNLIMKRASWRCVTSFAQFYDKELEQDECQVGEALLTNAI